MTAPTTREISDHAESPPSIAEIVEGEVRPHVSADHAELAAIISDEEIARVHGYASFGPSITPREVVNDGVRKYAVGYHSGYTQLTILLEHGLITRPRPGRYDANLTKKGKKYARVLYRREDALLSEIAALKGEVERSLPSISFDGEHAISDHRRWLARKLLDSKLDDGEAYGIAAYHPAITDLRTTQAERQRDEAVGLLRKATGLKCDDWRGFASFKTNARALLANQGADQ